MSPWPIFHCPVILPYIWNTIWCMNIILWDYKSVWPQNTCRSLWPIFHGPVIVPYILKTVWCMNIVLQDYESVWPDIWPQNKCRSLWPIFHGPVILLYILKNICCMNILLCDYKSEWHNIWPQNKCMSLWPILHGLVILPDILKNIWYSYFTQTENSDIIVLLIYLSAQLSNLTSHWDNIFYLCPINSFKLPVVMYFMLATHQIVTTVLLSLHKTDISFYRGENW